MGASVIQATRRLEPAEASDLVCDHTCSLHLDEVRSDFVLRTPSTGQQPQRRIGWVNQSVYVLGRHDVYEESAKMEHPRLQTPLSLSCTDLADARFAYAPILHLQHQTRPKEYVVTAVAERLVGAVAARTLRMTLCWSSYRRIRRLGPPCLVLGQAGLRCRRCSSKCTCYSYALPQRRVCHQAVASPPNNVFVPSGYSGTSLFSGKSTQSPTS